MAALARFAGAEIPFLEPAELASEDTLMAQVARHDWDVFENPCGVPLLKTTPPFVPSETADRVVESSLKGGPPVFTAVRRAEDDLKSLLKLDGGHVSFVGDVSGRRQGQPSPSVACGVVYVYTPSAFGRESLAERGEQVLELVRE